MRTSRGSAAGSAAAPRAVGAGASADAPYHHGDLREALVAEAYARVREQGAEAVSLRAIAHAVGVSPSAAYHHFPDKTALLVEVADRGALELDRRATQAAGGLGVEDAERGLARLRAVGAAYIGFAVDEPHLFRHTFGPYCAITAKGSGAPSDPGLPEPPVHPDSAYGLLIDTLDRLDALGALRRRDGVDLVAWAAVHGFAGLVLEGFLPPEASAVLVDVLGSLVTVPADHPPHPGGSRH